MLPSTIDAVRAILKTDPSVPVCARAQLLAVLRNGSASWKDKPQNREPRLVRRGEAARRLGVSLRTIDTWAAQGLLRKICLPNRVRSCGFASVDIDRLAIGKEDQ